MMWRDVVTLVQPGQVRNEYGEVASGGIENVEICANRLSVRQTEFYQALAAGLKPELVFEVMAAEFTGQPQLLHEGVTYYVIRTFTKNGERLELVCSRYPMEG
ncbi:phage head completion protein [Paenibacillus glycanilyticus]|uniref:phage head completion protein n=1 Tax=Paenibacillus glycanilyticus TaxID=126569 RepID=UPI000FD81D7A|nr:phage head-tail adapter protein [Paenibacillus glycanilyticus]